MILLNILWLIQIYGRLIKVVLMSFALFVFAQAGPFSEADFAYFAREPLIARGSMIPTEVFSQILLTLFNFATSLTGKFLLTVSIVHMPIEKRFRAEAFLANFTLEGFLVPVNFFMVVQ